MNTGAVVIRGLLSRLSDSGLTKSQLRGRRRRIAGKAGEKDTPAGRGALQSASDATMHYLPGRRQYPASHEPALQRARNALEAELSRYTIADVVAEVALLGTS